MPSLPLQNHIHLSTAVSGAPEYSPTYKWYVSDRIESSLVILSVRRALSGKLHNHVLSSGGNPIRFKNFDYIVRVDDSQDGMDTYQRLDLLQSMQGKRVYLVDHYHPDNNQDHAAAVRAMVLTKVGEAKAFTMKLPRYYVEISLEDDHL